jgi:hypothetical protein
MGFVEARSAGGPDALDVSRRSVDTNGMRIRTRLLRAAACAVPIALSVATLVAPAASAKPAYFAVSKESACIANRNVNPFLRQTHANVLRLILSPSDGAIGAGVRCVQEAHAAGFKVYLSLQFDNRWTPRQVASYFDRVLPAYAQSLWAIGVGNEQDLSTPTGYGQGKTGLSRDGRSAGQSYRAVWDAVEPVLVRRSQHAIRVYGEFSPWSFNANEQGFASGRPRGVQAIAAHCYHTTVGGLTQVPADAAWATHEHLPLWCSEMGPALTHTKPWAVRDTWGSWNAMVAKIEADSPNLKMAGYYYYPGF